MSRLGRGNPHSEEVDEVSNVAGVLDAAGEIHSCEELVEAGEAEEYGVDFVGRESVFDLLWAWIDASEMFIMSDLETDTESFEALLIWRRMWSTEDWEERRGMSPRPIFPRGCSDEDTEHSNISCWLRGETG